MDCAFLPTDSRHIMRPKVVIVTIVAAFGILAVVAFFKGVGSRITNNENQQVSQVKSSEGPTVAPGTNTAPQWTGSNAGGTVSPEVRQAVIDKEVDDIQTLAGQADGSNNVQIIAVLMEKFSNPEADVRRAALQALRELNDTNAVPGLEKVAQDLSDPHEKVAVQDAIEYIKMPSVTENVPPDLATNFPRISAATYTNIHFNPEFLRSRKK